MEFKPSLVAGNRWRVITVPGFEQCFYLSPTEEECPEKSHPGSIKKMVCNGMLLHIKNFVSEQRCYKPKHPVY